MSRKEMKNRITNWKTTVIGFMLIIASVISVFTHGATWVDVTPTIVIGLGLIFSKDEWIAGKVSILLLLSCNPVKQVLKDQQKFDVIAKEVIRRNYCKSDTVTVFKVKDSIVYKEIIKVDSVPCKDFDTTIGRARIKVSSGVLSFSNQDSIVYRTKTITNNIRDLAKEEVLSADIKTKDSIIHLKEIEIRDTKLKANEIASQSKSWMLRFWGLVSVLVLITSAKYLVKWPFLK